MGLAIDFRRIGTAHEQPDTAHEQPDIEETNPYGCLATHPYK